MDIEQETPREISPAFAAIDTFVSRTAIVQTIVASAFAAFQSVRSKQSFGAAFRSHFGNAVLWGTSSATGAFAAMAALRTAKRSNFLNRQILEDNAAYKAVLTREGITVTSKSDNNPSSGISTRHRDRLDQQADAAADKQSMNR